MIRITMVLAALCAPVHGTEPLMKEVSQAGRATVTYPRIFILNQDDVPVYASSSASASSPAAAEMGDLYFAKEEDNGRFLLGKFDALEGDFTEELGWVAEEYLLQNTQPLLVKDAVDSGALAPSVVSGQPSSYSDSNVLRLRVVSKPEAQIEVAKSPSGTATPEGYRFTWYYVFGVKKVGPDYFYLIGNQRALVDTPFIRGTEFTSPAARLLGWIDHEKVKEWCSNVVLEYNTDLAAVKVRVGVGSGGGIAKPSLMYLEPDEASKVVAREPLDEFWAGEISSKPQPAVSGTFRLARVSPHGLVPEVPRMHVLEKADDWYHVATLGSSDGNISPTDVAKVQTKLDDVNSALRQVDIVFVVDATGSMGNEIDEVRKWLTELCDELASKANSGAPLQFQAQRHEISLPGNMDVRVSLVAYQDIGAGTSASPFNTKLFLASADLSNDRNSIDTSFSHLNTSVLAGGLEALHDGLHAAISNDQLWRGDQATRLVIVVADEPGNSGDPEQQAVLAAMPLYQKVDQADDKDEDAYRRDHTQVFALYTESAGFSEFKNNLRMLVPANKLDARVFMLPGFEQSKSRRKMFSDQLFEALKFSQTLAQRKVRQLTSDLVNKKILEPVDSEEIPDSPSAVIMDRLAIEAAMKSAGVKSPQELSVLTKVAFTEGYVKEQQGSHSMPTYRLRATLTGGDVDELKTAMARLSKGLFRALDPNNPLGDILGTQNPKMIAAKALVLAIAEVEGSTELEDEEALQEAADKLVAEIQNEPSRSLRTILGIQSALPLNSDGLLGMPGDQLLSLKVTELEEQALALQRKARCLANMTNSETAPEDFTRIDEHRPSHKEWIYKHPNSGVEFYYVPMSYLP